MAKPVITTCTPTGGMLETTQDFTFRNTFKTIGSAVEKPGGNQVGT